MDRKVVQKVTGYITQDGAGVKLVRVLGHSTVKGFDPFLMLDSFDSRNPEDYIAGFPRHPHRGIETITYMSSGELVHKDSLGNSGVIRDGQVQWMTAGSGIMHEEMPQPVGRMLGVQVWLNLPAKDKMVPPAYHSIEADRIIDVPVEGGKVRVISGRYGEHEAFRGEYIDAHFYSIQLEAGAQLTLEVPEGHSAYLFTLLGDALVGGDLIEEKTAVSTTDGVTLKVAAAEEAIELLYLSAPRLDEEVAWGGPIVMANEADLKQAFVDLRTGNFIKDEIVGDDRMN
ncbi:MAG: pirin family protein [Clostridiaceae bacterium]|nr:pirin family protein [Clostridiaceae bacterium]